ncbi:MAG: type II toxin-antitoxin system RelE/ParE family toxin [Planctomycetota bacterium]|nr:type II toxin-antitoxin system RelE/ParE family toxin [Planctomycetota bacterium]
MKRVYIEPSAKADVESVFWYYELAHPGLGREFKSRIAEALRRIAEYPGATAEIEPGVRWLMLKQFPSSCSTCLKKIRFGLSQSSTPPRRPTPGDVLSVHECRSRTAHHRGHRLPHVGPR